MFIPKTLERSVFISSPDVDLESMLPKLSKKEDRLAVACLMSFFQDDRDALQAGLYTVEIKRNLIGLPKFRLASFRAMAPKAA